MGKQRFCAMAKEVLEPALEGRTAQAGFKPFEIYREINVSVPTTHFHLVSRWSVAANDMVSQNP